MAVKHSIVVTEQKQDQLLLEALLDDPDVRIVAAGGWSGADSLARSFLAIGEDNVALVVDADTTDPSLAEDRKRFLQQSLGDIRPPSAWRVFVIAPEIEALLFQDRKVIEGLVGREVTDTDLDNGRCAPRSVLSALLHQKSLSDAYSTLRELNLNLIRDLPEIRELRSFASGQSKSRSKKSALKSDNT